nr:helix-turn-helix domain-containing protein [Pseudoalteromonas sp. ACER1]
MNLNESEFDIIAYLAKNMPQPVSREVLFKHVIGREYDGLDRAIDLKVSRLRKKLKDTISSHKNSLDIKSVRGKGYSLDISKL